MAGESEGDCDDEGKEITSRKQEWPSLPEAAERSVSRGHMSLAFGCVETIGSSREKCWADTQ